MYTEIVNLLFFTCRSIRQVSRRSGREIFLF